MRKPRPKCIALSYHYRLPPGTWKSVPPGSKWRQYASFPPYVVGPAIDDGFPMPNLTDVMHRVGSGRFITVCDAKSGYWQLYVKPEHRWLTAFVTHHGLFSYYRTYVPDFAAIAKPLTDLTGSRQPSALIWDCLLYTSPSPRDRQKSRMPSSA